ncbi:MAG: aminoglycoside phosphotransferase family protein [Chloroflexota bacterium]
MELPQSFIETVHNVFGDEGRTWLPTLPDLLQQCREKWDLPEGVRSSHLSMGYIEFTTLPNDLPVALKLCIHNPELFTEMEALQVYDGKGAVRFIDADRQLGAILMERVQPGTMLLAHGDNREQTEIAAQIMRQLPAPVPATHSMPMFTRWVTRAFHDVRTELDPTERMPRKLLDKTETALNEIVHNSPGDVVLHGDLHHENILFDQQQGWVAIDPKGAIGPPVLELGRFMQNQLPNSQSGDDWFEQRVALVDERIGIFSEILRYTREEIAASALVDCVLSHCWGLEEEGVSLTWGDGVLLGQYLCEIADL